ncbi:hypothetical protein [Streptomyces sp. NPDC001275]
MPTESTAGADSAALMRERADAFVFYASDPDPQVRRAAIEGIGLFVADAHRAVAILRGRLPVENGIAERLLVVQTMADLALRLSAARASVTAPAVVPLLEGLLNYWHHEAADVLGRIGSEAKAVLPRLRQMLDAGYEWTRVFAAAALWDIGGEAEAGVVVPTLLTAWEENDATSNHVLACLNRMGPATAPTLPRLRGNSRCAPPRRSLPRHRQRRGVAA